MQDLTAKKLGLFFTRGVSLELWDRVGNFSREVKPYNELAKTFNQIYFFTYGSEADFGYQKYLADNIVIVPKRWNVPDSLYMLLLPILEMQKLKQIDIFKTNQMEGAFSALLAKLLYRKQLVVRCGFEWLSFLQLRGKPFWLLQIINIYEALVYKGADQIILSAKNLQQFVVSHFHNTERKITIIPNYIDTDLFHPKDTERKKKSLCFVGRLNPQKNLFNLISSVAGLDVTLSIYGSGELKTDLEKHAKTLQAPVEFCGNVSNDELPSVLNQYEAFILPSFFEGNPKVLLEAMSCGMPVIGADVVGIQELISHRNNGYLCATDAESLRNAILEVLGDDELRTKIGTHARETILTTNALPLVIQKEQQVYEKLYA